jgi:GT2 family glycosyltransferase
MCSVLLLMHHTVFVVPTPKSYEEFKNSEPYNTLENIIPDEDHTFEIEILNDNKKGISELYNDFLSVYAEELHYTNVVFLHDDVEIHDRFILKKLKKAHERYNVVGLAGATSQDYTSSSFTPAWHLSMKDRKDGRGFVSHTIPKDVGGYPFPYINSSYFGPSPSEVVFVDGLFVSFDMEAWRKNPIKFEEKYTFHHYDMSLCAELKKNGFSIGVWPIYVIHYGLGEFQNDPLWHKLATEFKQQYKDYKISS